MSNSKLPEHSSLEYLKKLAKSRLRKLRQEDPNAKLAIAQLSLAREYGFKSWRALNAQLDTHRPKRKIASPTMRFLAVADLDRSVAFYREAVGCQVAMRDDAAEAVLGPARISLGKREVPAGGWLPGAAGSSILFLQCDDVEATHAELRNRGAAPSDIESVNWIKMRMFEVRDPDGNLLWFGQSYRKRPDSPSRGKSQPHGLQQALPELPFDDVSAAVAYYRDVMGFRINYQKEDVGVMDRDAITILLIARTKKHQGIGSFEVYVEDADTLYAELLAKGAQVDGPPVSHPWGLRDFRVEDPEGNRITFAQRFE